MTTPQHHDEPFDRLRGADPAASAVPDSDALRRIAFERAGIESVEKAVSVDGGQVVDLAARRRRSPWLAAAAAAVVVGVGAGGYAFGESGNGQTMQTAPVTVTRAEAAPDTQVAPAGPGNLSSDLLYPGPVGSSRTVFVDGGVAATGGSTGVAWSYDAAAVYTKETAARVAQALGIAGDVREEAGAYLAGPTDGSGPSMFLQADGMASLSYVDPAIPTWTCAVDPTVGVMDQSDPAAMPAPEPCAQGSTGVAPSPEVAIAQMRDLLDRMGVDTSTLDFTAMSDDGSTMSVHAVPQIEGIEGSPSWTAIVTEDGIGSLSGSLAPLVNLGEYPLVSPAQAIERLTDPRFGADPADMQPHVIPAVPQPAVPPAVQPGARLSWPVTQVTITSAKLGLTQVWQEDGAVILAPAYVLSAADGSSWSVVAVADEGLAFGG